MSVLVLLLALNIVTTPTSASEEQTLLHGEIENGGFGGLVVKCTEIRDEFGVLVGFRGGWIINHSLVIGGAGYGLASQNYDIDPTEIGGLPGRDYCLELGYGGMELGFVHNSHKLVHVAVQTLIGAGGVCYVEDDWHSDSGDDCLDGDAFFIVEPGIDFLLNVARPFRIGIGASYRFVKDVDLPALENSDIAGFSMGITFKFGRF